MMGSGAWYDAGYMVICGGGEGTGGVSDRLAGPLESAAGRERGVLTGAGTT